MHQSVRKTQSVSIDRPTLEYQVQDRDSLNSIAAKFNSTPSEICTINKRISRTIFPGQVLLIPDPDAPVPEQQPETVVTSSSSSEVSSNTSPAKTPVTETSSSSLPTPSSIKATSTAALTKLGFLSQPGHVERVEDPYERKFIKCKVRLMTICNGVVSGTLLLTPNTILFDPNVSDPLVIDRGQDTYSLTHPLCNILSVKLFTSPELMVQKREDREHEEELLYDPNTTDNDPIVSSSVEDSTSILMDLSSGYFSTARSHLPSNLQELTQNLATSAADKLHPHLSTQFKQQPLYLCISMKPTHHTTSASSTKRQRLASQSDELWFTINRCDADQVYQFLKFCVESSVKEVDSKNDEVFSSSEEYYFVESEDCQRSEWFLLCSDHQMVLPSKEDVPLPEVRMCCVDDCSKLMNTRRLRHIVDDIPPRAEGQHLYMIYSASQHGFSLGSIYRSMSSLEHDTYTLVMILDTNGHLFGSLLSSTIRINETFYGSGESFVFRWSRDVDVHSGDDDDDDDLHNSIKNDYYSYHWTGENNYFVRGALDALFIGSCQGHTSIWIDKSLYRGRSQSCLTFNNPILCGCNEDFLIQDLEIFVFSDCQPL